MPDPTSPQVSEIQTMILESIKYKKDNSPSKLLEADMAKGMDLSVQGFWKIKNGLSIPTDTTINKMANYFYETDEELRADFKNRLTLLCDAARKEGRPPDDKEGPESGDIVARLWNGETLRVKKLGFPPFSTFFDTILDRLADLGDFRGPDITADQLEDSPSIRDVRDELRNNKYHLISGHFATVYRSLLVHFWSSPIRLGLGAVMHAKHDRDTDEKQRIQEILAGKRDPSPIIRPIVVEQEVGAIHCLKTLKGFNRHTGVKVWPKLDAGKLVEIFNQIIRDEPTVVPVIVTNEWTSFEALKLLGSDGAPVLPLFSREASRRSPRLQLPTYFLSIGCSRRQQEFREMMAQSLLLFLSTEVETTSDSLVELQATLMQRVQEYADFYPEYRTEGPNRKALRFRAAYQWTLYALGLDQLSIDNSPRSGLPWRAIQRRAREKTLAKVSDEEITMLINLVAPKNALSKSPEDDSKSPKDDASKSSVPLSEDQFRLLRRSFDLDIELKGVQREYVLEDRRILTRTIRNVLQSRPVGLPFEYIQEKGETKQVGGDIKVVNPREDVAFQNVLDGFLAELQELYKGKAGLNYFREKEAPDALIGDFRLRLRGDLKSKKDHAFGEKKDERVIMASIGETNRRYIGAACLRPYDHPTKDNSRWLELFYLFNLPAYRHLAVAEHIIHKAHSYAKEEGYDYLVVEVPQTLNEGVIYFLKREFAPHDQQSRQGRLVLKYSCKRPFPQSLYPERNVGSSLAL